MRNDASMVGWADKPPASEVMIPAKIHHCRHDVEQRQAHAMVNEAVRLAASRTAPAAFLRLCTKG
jgi:hypothetical protein